MAQGFFQVTDNWTAQNFSTGQWSVKLQDANASLLVSENPNGEVIFNSTDFNNGLIPLNVVAQQDYYFKLVGGSKQAKVFYSDSFFFRVKGGGGGGGGTPPTGNYTFSAPLVDTQGNISIALSQSLKVTQDRLDLNLTANADFKNASLGIDEAKKIATYTSVGRVMPKEHHFQLNASSGELELDLSPTGVLSQGFTPKQDFTTLDSEAVKITNIPQDIDGAKNFVRELSALAIQLKQNSANGGGVDIHSENGYFSISKDNQGVYQLLAGLGFIDNTTSFRIRNLNGGIVTFNTLAQYEQTFTPTDNKDLVHLAYVKQVKAELMALIQQAQGGLTLIGTIPNTKAEVEANYTLLDNFVQQEAGRPKQKGDFIITSDRWGFVYNGTNWVNFGQVSIVIATTTQAGLMMFGTNAGELEDIGNGKAKVIGWDTVIQALRDLHRRISSNSQNIQQIQTSLRDYARLGADNTFTGNNTFSGNNAFTGGFKIQSANNPAFELKDTGGNKSCIIQTIDSGQNLQFTLPSGGAVQFNGVLRYPWNARPTVAADNEIPSYKQIKDEFATTSSLDLKANDDEVVKLTGDQTITGVKKFHSDIEFGGIIRAGWNAQSLLFTPEDDSTKTLKFRDTSVGTNNKFNLDLENVCGLTGIKDPASARDAVPRDWANNQYIPKVTTTATNGIQVTSNSQKVFNFDYVWDNANSGYRNWSGIKLRCKAQSASAFTDMFYLEYRNDDSLGIFMTCVSNKLTFANPTKLKGVSCEDADSDDTATSKGWIQTNYKKSVIMPVGGSLPTQTASDTIYYIEV